MLKFFFWLGSFVIQMHDKFKFVYLLLLQLWSYRSQCFALFEMLIPQVEDKMYCLILYCRSKEYLTEFLTQSHCKSNKVTSCFSEIQNVSKVNRGLSEVQYALLLRSMKMGFKTCIA